MDRREFLKNLGLSGLAASPLGSLMIPAPKDDPANDNLDMPLFYVKADMGQGEAGLIVDRVALLEPHGLVAVSTPLSMTRNLIVGDELRVQFRIKYVKEFFRIK